MDLHSKTCVPFCHTITFEHFKIRIVYSHSLFKSVHTKRFRARNLSTRRIFPLSSRMWSWSSFFSASVSRHSGGGCDLHRQGAAQCHEHLQSQTQGTGTWDRTTTTNIWSFIYPAFWMYSCVVDCLLKGWTSSYRSCSESHLTKITLLAGTIPAHIP